MTTDDTKPSRLSRREALRTGAQAGLAALAVGAVAGNAEAQIETGPLSTTRETITLVAAGALVAAAVAKAQEIGVPMAIAVVDESGVLKAFGRMDGAGPASVEIVQAKAFTAAAFRVPTSLLAERNQNNPAVLASFPNFQRVTLLPGGIPIRSGNAVIGGIGVGGGTGQQDIEVAEAALAAIIRSEAAPQ